MIWKHLPSSQVQIRGANFHWNIVGIIMGIWHTSNKTYIKKRKLSVSSTKHDYHQVQNTKEAQNQIKTKRKKNTSLIYKEFAQRIGTMRVLQTKLNFKLTLHQHHHSALRVKTQFPVRTNSHPLAWTSKRQ